MRGNSHGGFGGRPCGKGPANLAPRRTVDPTRTLKEWLEDHAPFQTGEDLQLTLDGFRQHYNQDRPHQGLDDATPAERYQPKRGPRPRMPPVRGQPLYPPGSVVRKVDRAGVTSYRATSIGLGKRWRHLLVRVVELGGVTHIYFGEELIRSLVIDPEATYQRSNGTQDLTRAYGQGRSRQRQ